MNYDSDVEKLYRACKGLGTKEQDIIDVVSKRKLTERHQIRLLYLKKYNKDLLDVLRSELSGDFRNLVVYLFLGPIQVLACQLFEIIDASGKAAEKLNEIICCCNPSELTALKLAYDEDKKRTLITDVEKETKGSHQVFLRKFLTQNRREFTKDELRTASTNGRWDALIDYEKVNRDTVQLHDSVFNAKSKKVDESRFITVISEYNILELRSLYDEFRERYETTIVEFITKNIKNPLRNALNTVIMTAVELEALLISQLYNSMRGVGTDEKTLSRIIAIRSEVDLLALKPVFDEKIGRSLVETIKSDTSGDYRTLLLALLREN